MVNVSTKTSSPAVLMEPDSTTVKEVTSGALDAGNVQLGSLSVCTMVKQRRCTPSMTLVPKVILMTHPQKHVLPLLHRSQVAHLEK